MKNNKKLVDVACGPLFLSPLCSHEDAHFVKRFCHKQKGYVVI